MRKSRSTSGRRDIRRLGPEAAPAFRATCMLSLKALARGLKVIGGVILAGLALAIISGFLVAGYLYISESDYFTVKKVVISGLNQTVREDILRAAGLDRPVNIWLFDADQAEADLAGLPWLDEVRVSKTKPDTVNIEVREHRAKFLVSLGRLHYLNEDGCLFKELEPGENPNLVIVSGFTEDELLSRTPRVKTALAGIFNLMDVLAARHDEFKLDQISEINYDPVRGLTLFTRRGELEVKVGFGAYEEKFRRLSRVGAHLKQQGQFEGLVYINLEASPRVIVRPG